jgi:cell wall-associated NlpC family hydrolase
VVPLKLGAVAFALTTCLVVSLTVVASTEAAQPARMPVCASTGPVNGLSAAQAQNARTVVAVAEPRGGRQSALVAVMVSLAESDLRSLGNPTAGTPDAGEGVGYDHDSVGLFQQRASWGSAAERMDAVTSTNLFLDALLSQDGWESRPPWVAAQHVQRSAFDGRPSAANHGSAVYGGNYQAQLARARAILAAIGASSLSTDRCGGVDVAPGGISGPPGAHGLPAAYAVPATTSMAARIAVTYALAQRGKPYLWGGTGPDRFDCSGLTQRAWAQAGRAIGRTTYDQLRDGTETTVAQLQPGDLVLIPGSQGTLASPGHMGMYVGSGLVVHAPRTGDVIRVTALAAFTAGGISGLRHIA